MTRYRIGVDIGGTFTDIVLDRGTDRITRKVLTTAKRPEEGVLQGTRLVLADAGLHFSDIDVFVHGTTLATNAIIERRGARTALIATDGFRDTLDIATGVTTAAGKVTGLKGKISDIAILPAM